MEPNSASITNNSNTTIKRADSSIRISPEHQLYMHYHESEINHNEKLSKHCLWLMWIGVGILIISLVFYAITGRDIINAVIAGAFVDIFSGGVIALVNKSSENKHKYFESISNSETEQRLINEMSLIDDPNKKAELLGKIIDGHYNSL